MLILETLAAKLPTADVQACVHEGLAIPFTCARLLAHLSAGLRRLQAVSRVHRANFTFLALLVFLTRQFAVIEARDTGRRARKAVCAAYALVAATSVYSRRLTALAGICTFVTLVVARTMWLISRVTVTVAITFSATDLVHAALAVLVVNVALAHLVILCANPDALLTLVLIGGTGGLALTIMAHWPSCIRAVALLRALVTLRPRSILPTLAHTDARVAKGLVLAVDLLAIVVQSELHSRALGT